MFIEYVFVDKLRAFEEFLADFALVLVAFGDFNCLFLSILLLQVSEVAVVFWFLEFLRSLVESLFGQLHIFVFKALAPCPCQVVVHVLSAYFLCVPYMLRPTL